MSMEIEILRSLNNNYELLRFSKIALVIIENGARWSVENFVLSRYNHR